MECRDGFASDYHINVFNLENRIVFTNEGKVYTYNDLYDSIMVFDFIQNQIKDKFFCHRHIFLPVKKNTGFPPHLHLIFTRSIQAKST